MRKKSQEGHDRREAWPTLPADKKIVPSSTWTAFAGHGSEMGSRRISVYT